MSIVVNGTTIPENVANALNVNGTNITSVVCNGTTVWTQSLFNALWSGSSIAGYNIGFQTAGSQYRASMNIYYGTWQTLSILGIFSGDSLTVLGGFMVSGNLIKTNNRESVASTWVTLTLITKVFSGSSVAPTETDALILETSGGLLRCGFTPDAGYGPYISVS